MKMYITRLPILLFFNLPINVFFIVSTPNGYTKPPFLIALFLFLKFISTLVGLPIAGLLACDCPLIAITPCATFSLDVGKLLMYVNHLSQ